MALKTLCISRYSCVSNVSKPLYELHLQDILTLWLPPQAGRGQRDNGKARKSQKGEGTEGTRREKGEILNEEGSISESSPEQSKWEVGFFEGPQACERQDESGALRMWGRKGCPEFWGWLEHRGMS